jgi:hypothetical protein
MKKEEIRLILFLWIFLTPVLFPAALKGWGRKPPPEPKTVEERIARQFHIGESAVLGLQEKGYGTEEVIKLLIVATATGKRPDEISISREEGKSWEEIAKRYGIGMDTLDKETRELLSKVEGKGEEGIGEEKKPEVELKIEK